VNYCIKQEPPSAKKFSELRLKAGWGEINLKMAQQSINNSLFHVTAYSDSKVIGMARIIGDGVMYFYIQDVVIDPKFQRMGIGKALMEEIEKYLSKAAKKGATIALLSAHGKEKFYTGFDYIERSGDPLGKAMCKFI
jgi:ribosomal protein S18 acetylase RimI-like enzyme